MGGMGNHRSIAILAATITVSGCGPRAVGSGAVPRSDVPSPDGHGGYETIVRNQVGVSELESDDRYIYWTAECESSSGKSCIRRITKDPGGDIEELAVGEHIENLSVGERYVHWVDAHRSDGHQDEIWRLVKDDERKILLASGYGCVLGFVCYRDGDSLIVFFSAAPECPVGSSDDIQFYKYEESADGTKTTNLDPLGYEHEYSARAILITAERNELVHLGDFLDFVYTVSDKGEVISVWGSKQGRVLLSLSSWHHGEKGPIGYHPGPARRLMIKEDHVYWLEYSKDGTVSKTPLLGLCDWDPSSLHLECKDQVVLADSQYYPVDLVVDDVHVYWATSDGYIRRAPR